MVRKSLLAFACLIVTSCANVNYKVGDFSKAYCQSVNGEFRAQIKAVLKEKGVEIGIDYCSAHGLIDALRGG